MTPIRITDSIAYRIHRAARLLRKHFLDLGKRNGVDLTPEQWFILNKLSGSDGLSQVELGETIFSDRPNITRMVQAMEQAGHVRRREDPEDARRILVFLTPSGRRIHDRFAALVPDARERLFAGIRKEDVEATERLLDRLEENLERDLD